MKTVNTETKKPVCDTIRDVIGTIPPAELPYAKPSRVLPGVVAAGFEATSSVKSMVSKLLATAKKDQKAQVKVGKIIPLPVEQLPHLAADRTGLAMKLVEACGNDFSLARSEIDRLEKFAKAIKGA